MIRLLPKSSTKFTEGRDLMANISNEQLSFEISQKCKRYFLTLMGTAHQHLANT